MVVFGSPTPMEAEEADSFKERIIEYAETLNFDPKILIKQLPMFESEGMI